MLRDEIIEMAKQAGFVEYELVWFQQFEAFAKLVADVATAKEREACADLCATWYDPMWSERNQAGNELATAIRARGEA